VCVVLKRKNTALPTPSPNERIFPPFFIVIVIFNFNLIMQKVRIGVVALQGAFKEHLDALSKIEGMPLVLSID
jgi:hypothetical protein